MRLIVTRPEADAAALALQLEAAGHTVMLAPLLSIRAIDTLEVPERDYQAVLITSANGARALEGRAELARLKTATAIVVGPASAEAATRAGFERVEEADGDVHALVQNALALLRPGDGPLLYVSGAVTAGDLAATLQGAGFEVDRVIAYEARRAEALPGPCAAAIAAGGADGVVLYSPRSARVWAALVADAGLSRAASELVYYCLSENVAGAVRDGLGDGVAVQVARRPNESALLELIPALA
ncbi:MAG TPA: uroporphyrinogen-III synthase [Aestuariivirgaceae bacterium]|nr:uroporphyrinogen-III synthase [Aestuariivirgaceae bacterium]